MMKENFNGKCGSSSHKSMKEKEKYLVDKIQGIFSNIQLARKESRANDIVIFEEQMHQLLREWQAELESPATSLAVCLWILANRFKFYIYIYYICWHSIGWEPWFIYRGSSSTVASNWGERWCNKSINKTCAFEEWSSSK